MRVFPLHFNLKLMLLGDTTSRCICRISERVEIAIARAQLCAASGEGEVEVFEASLACGNTAHEAHSEAQSKPQFDI